MPENRIPHNECEQATLKLEHAFLESMGTGNRWSFVTHIANHLYHDELRPRIVGSHGAALGRAIDKRLANKKIIEIDDSGGWWSICRS